MVTVNVQDFALVTTSSFIPVAQGGCTSSNLDVVSLGGFVGTVSLTGNTPSGINATLTPTTIINSGTSIVTICATSTVPTGSYQVTITGAGSSSSHQSTLSITVTPGTSTPPPVLTQATWNHRFSLSKYSNVQTWKLGASNPSIVTEYISIQILGIDNTGVSGFTLSTSVITLTPGQNIVHINLTKTFSSSQIGETFTFNISIQWGLTATTDPNALPFNSTVSNGQPTSGSFTVLQ
jgi:hypothetical protein